MTAYVVCIVNDRLAGVSSFVADGYCCIGLLLVLTD